MLTRYRDNAELRRPGDEEGGRETESVGPRTGVIR